jgi:hypothetical protein
LFFNREFSPGRCRALALPLQKHFERKAVYSTDLLGLSFACSLMDIENDQAGPSRLAQDGQDDMLGASSIDWVELTNDILYLKMIMKT